MPERPGGAPAPLRLALYSGVCVRHDAISNGLRLKLDVIDRWREAGATVEAVAFVHACDYDDPRIRRIDSVKDLLCMAEFRSANVHVFEFGIYYPLFDAVFLLPRNVRTVGVYHNITPPDLADDPASRAALERSLVQRHNLSCMHQVICHGDYSRRELISMGLRPERLSVVPLPPAVNPRTPSRQPRFDGVVELLYVGRFARAKGVLDLLAATEALASSGRHDFRLTMAGNPRLSSPEVMAEMDKRISSDVLHGHVRVVPAPHDERLGELYAAADIFVIPSYHEGYCVPVIEALAAGCQVVSYDSSNLPFTVDGLGLLVPTGDVAALTAALDAGIERLNRARTKNEPMMVATGQGEIEHAAWRGRIATHLEAHSVPAFEAGFAAALAAVTYDRPAAPTSFPQALAGAGLPI